MAECTSCAQLRRALESRDVIATAKGLVMARFGMTASDAFDLLIKLSQSSNVRVSEISARVIADYEAELG